MKIKSINLETVCGVSSRLPNNSLPEFAFAGKSNVGKCSLINAFMNRKSYARISSQPGKTQTINYYNINDALYLVDLPGYGYATANVKVRQKWGEMIERYLNTSEALKAVFLLIDIRHEPSNNDIMMYDWIVQAGFNPIIIATKADKIKRSQLPKHKKMIRETIKSKSRAGADLTFQMIAWSGLSKQGREEIYDLLDREVLGIMPAGEAGEEPDGKA